MKQQYGALLREGVQAREHETTPHVHDLVAIGASAGGVEALTQLIHGLPADLPAAVCVVMHLPPQGSSMLPQILQRHGRLPAKHPHDGDPLELGHIYVAPPDRHLLVERGRLRITHGPRENRSRPAVDPLFRSAAHAYATRAIGVVLTGALDDGTAGLLAIKRRGGIAVVQDPLDALIPSMPASALDYVAVDQVAPVAGIARLLTRLVHEPAGDAPSQAGAGGHMLRYETSMAAMDEGTVRLGEMPGALTALTCPECGGPVFELHEDELMRFRCRSGHANTYESMAAGQAESVEEVLWAALNTLMESAQFAARLARGARARGHQHTAARFEERVAESQRRAELIRGLLRSGDSTVPLDLPDAAATSTGTWARFGRRAPVTAVTAAVRSRDAYVRRGAAAVFAAS